MEATVYSDTTGYHRNVREPEGHTIVLVYILQIVLVGIYITNDKNNLQAVLPYEDSYAPSDLTIARVGG